ncbi:hypothetical protein [Candidatus Frankia nodulisporulans]|uniref:hypothetical protein n=1 Tax=Candidatus Frankia nodulisporulans TaxID=2060052 RepID=UPI0013D25EEC|nr:hypothetical protein [Candidatus Frankia nodulisporulans]
MSRRPSQQTTAGTSGRGKADFEPLVCSTPGCGAQALSTSDMCGSCTAYDRQLMAGAAQPARDVAA